MTNHRVKIQSRFYKDVLSGKKKFEVRKNDRNYQVGDTLTIMEWDYENGCQKTDSASGKKVESTYIINYVLTHGDFPDGICEGYCVLGIQKYYSRNVE